MAQVRRARAHWSGDLQTGGGAVSTATSGVFSEQPTTWRARTEEPEGGTSPEELLAAAHAACFSMAVSNELSKAGFPPSRVDVSVEVTGDRREAGWTVIASHITLRAAVPGVDTETFREKTEAAKVGCPISRAIKGNVEISLDATLEA